MSETLWLLAISVVGLAWVWALRHWMLRTWRTAAVLGVGTIGMFGAIALLPFPLGLMVGMAVGAASFWLVAIGSQFFWTMSGRDYFYAEALRMTDGEAADLLSGIGESHEVKAVSLGLVRLIEQLEGQLRADALDLARDIHRELRILQEELDAATTDRVLGLRPQ